MMLDFADEVCHRLSQLPPVAQNIDLDSMIARCILETILIRLNTGLILRLASKDF